MADPTYIRWDYDQNVATEFVRHGDCNRCGQCCRAVIEFVTSKHGALLTGDPAEDDPREGGRYTIEGEDGKVHGIWNEVVNDQGERRYFQVTEIDTDAIQQGHRCPVLEGEAPGEFACGKQMDKTLICKGWPFAPEQVTPFDQCSYTFEEVRRWPIEGNESE